MKTSTYDEVCEEDEEEDVPLVPTDSADVTPVPSVWSLVRPRPRHCSPPPPPPPPVPTRTLKYVSPEAPALAAIPSPSESCIVEEPEEQSITYRDIELFSPEEVFARVEVTAERWSDTTSTSLPALVEDVETVTSDTDPVNAQCDPNSDMYYTASSEVSLLSDTEVAVEKVQTEHEEKDDRKNVIAGHVAAMRERFESMTRTNTPCPDLIRSLSPSLEVFRNTSPSPDRLA